MVILHDKEEIAAFLRQNIPLHIYSLGDLDDFFWPHTVWYAGRQNGAIEAIILLYTALPLPTLLALADDLAPMQALLQSILHLLPRRFYAHLSPGLEEVVGRDFRLLPYGRHYKMILTDRSRLDQVDFSRAARLSAADLPAVQELYQASYPGNWFDARMLDTNHYYGVWEEGRLVSIAGVHVYSPTYGVAALGNITTHPAHRGRGLGKIVTARLCASLLETVDQVGLNVKADNQPAVTLYHSLGFTVAAEYDEYTIEARGGA
ncbi:MAG: GNAT family N-acetyltransferase [Chloroflexi bacterium]|nr:GNAT family N-acetyltransferase [Chloroflexota bacterium]MCI0650054.1 GNAT family N-acetyltransferase [Chloroflexota bacterium]MCI0727015.1 GNAT family N-acetyltransferase [Chloroflexota bacterium]